MSSLAATRADGYYYPKDFDPSKHVSVLLIVQKTIHDYNRQQKEEKMRKKYGDKYRGDQRKEDGSHKVRFEAPFHIRCSACNNMMAKGVRFNAIKKVGSKTI